MVTGGSNPHQAVGNRGRPAPHDPVPDCTWTEGLALFQAHCLFVDHGYTDWLPLDKLSPLDTDVNQCLPYQVCGVRNFLYVCSGWQSSVGRRGGLAADHTCCTSAQGGKAQSVDDGAGSSHV